MGQTIPLAESQTLRGRGRTHISATSQPCFRSSTGWIGNGRLNNSQDVSAFAQDYFAREYVEAQKSWHEFKKNWSHSTSVGILIAVDIVIDRNPEEIRHHNATSGLRHVRNSQIRDSWWLFNRMLLDFKWRRAMSDSRMDAISRNPGHNDWIYSLSQSCCFSQWAPSTLRWTWNVSLANHFSDSDSRNWRRERFIDIPVQSKHRRNLVAGDAINKRTMWNARLLANDFDWLKLWT